MGLKLSESHLFISASVHNCTFIDNQAYSFGGGMYILFGELSAHVVTLHNCTFARNKAGSGGGGLLVVFFGPGTEDSFSFINTSDCLFKENVAKQGAASYVTLPGSASKYGIQQHSLFLYMMQDKSCSSIISSKSPGYIAQQKCSMSSIVHLHTIYYTKFRTL